MSEITDSLDRLIAVGDACKRLNYGDDSVLYCTSMTTLIVGDLVAVKALRAENERLAKEISDYGFYGALERAEAPLKETIASLEAEKQRLITNHFGQSQKAWEQCCNDVTEARELGYQSGIDVITLHIQKELQDTKNDLEFAYKRSKVLADILEIPVHESSEVTGTILGLVRSKVERLTAELTAVRADAVAMANGILTKDQMVYEEAKETARKYLP